MEKAAKKHQQFRVLVSRDEDGYYVVECPALRGCFTQGKTLTEALKNIKEAIELCLEDEDVQDYAPVLAGEGSTLHTVVI